MALAAIAACGAVHAQDLEPRAYSNAPTGLNFLIVGYGHTSGTVLTDPALPIDNGSIKTDFAAFAYAHVLDVFGKSAKVDLVEGYGWLSAEGDVSGVRRYRDITGYTDPLLRFSMNFIGAPALTMEEFKDYKQDLVIGGSLRLGIPLGQYDDDKLVNIGSNRWMIKPEFGVSKAIGAWTAEFTPAINFYTDNNDFFGGKSREQDPVYSTQASISYTFRPGMWAALATTYFKGGQTTVDGVTKDDEQEGLRLGLTLAIPVSREQSFKLYANTGYNADHDRDYNAVGIAWQYRWGGGF
ncbi:MAG: transporter [Luteolibacter sp.]